MFITAAFGDTLPQPMV